MSSITPTKESQKDKAAAPPQQPEQVEEYPIAIGYPYRPNVREEEGVVAPATSTSRAGNQEQHQSTQVAQQPSATNRRMLYALLYVAVLTVAIGLIVGLTKRKDSGFHVDPPEYHEDDDEGEDYDYSSSRDEQGYAFDEYWHSFPGYGDYGPIEYCGRSHSGLIARGLSNACGYPLRSMRVDALVIGEIAQVILTQEFQTIPMQAHPRVTQYQLPLDEQAAVTAFRAEIDDRVIQGVVKEREQAQQEFEDAVNAGLNAYLGEQVRPDIFHISVGNLPPGKVVRVVITYVAPLRSLGPDLQQFVLPTEVSPRYDPFHNSKDPIPAGQNLMNNGVMITLTVLSYTPLFRVFSDTHTLEITENDHIANVRVVDENPLEWDLVVSFETIEAPEDPAVYMEESDEHGLAMMLSLVPGEVLSDTIPAIDDTVNEFVFVVDRSGSMSGVKMAQLKSAMLYILMTSLPDNALFNIISFGGRYEALFDESQPKQTHLTRAISYVNSFDSNFGGTEILAPLQFVLGQDLALEENKSRIVFVITDGEVSNTDDVIEYVAASRGTFTRVFALGVGPHASRNLVQGIARAGGGTADFVDGDSDEAIWTAVERQMDVALSPVFSNVEVVWLFALDEDEEVTIEQAPYFPPPLLLHRRFIMYFLAEATKDTPLSMILTADLMGADDQVISLEVTSDQFVPAPQSSVIHQMAARELIRDLEEGRSKFHDSQVHNPGLEEEVRAEIVRLGEKYQIASSETSFIAIDTGDALDVVTDETEQGEETGSPVAAPTSPSGSPVDSDQSLQASSSRDDTITDEESGLVHGYGYDESAGNRIAVLHAVLPVVLWLVGLPCFYW